MKRCREFFVTEHKTTRRLLAVFAHPDDETFGTGGTLAHYARQGVEVHLICATRGEVGEAPADLKGFPSVGAMREDELRCAAGILSLKAVYFLGYRDSGMPGSADNTHPQACAAQPVEKLAREVARYIREVRPQVVITFDPIGGYRHPDHIAIHRATVEAFKMTGNWRLEIGDLPAYSPQKLYFSTFPRRFLKMVVRVLRLLGRDPAHFGKNKDIDIASLAEVDFPIHAAVPIHDVMDLKEKAAACHASQGGSMPPILRWLQRVLGGSETYMRAFPAEAPPRRERDLFEGVK
ncbi:MAG: PIG-L family deacetylase [Chloroflexi bacterium]|nr:PIG-L family deacetylase [Chloroflexota bacterium]